MKKKGLIIALAAVIFLGVGYSVSAQTGVFSQEQAQKSSDSSSTSTSAQKSANKSSKKVAESSVSPAQGSQKNTSTAQTLDQTATFYFKGMNLPSNVVVNDLDGDNPTVTFTFMDDSTATFAVQVNQVTSKSIRVFSQRDNSVETVTAQTQISIGQQQSGSTSHANMTNNNLYLFDNGNGSYSLATPNYAGNTDEADRDVMAEAIQK